MKKTSRPAPSTASLDQRKAAPMPANMADASQLAEQLMKITLHANELTLLIADSERRTAELKGNLAEVQKTFAAFRPKVEGLMQPLNFNL